MCLQFSAKDCSKNVGCERQWICDGTCFLTPTCGDGAIDGQEECGGVGEVDVELHRELIDAGDGRREAACERDASNYVHMCIGPCTRGVQNHAHVMGTPQVESAKS